MDKKLNMDKKRRSSLLRSFVKPEDFDDFVMFLKTIRNEDLDEIKNRIILITGGKMSGKSAVFKLIDKLYPRKIVRLCGSLLAESNCRFSRIISVGKRRPINKISSPLINIISKYDLICYPETDEFDLEEFFGNLFLLLGREDFKGNKAIVILNTDIAEIPKGLEEVCLNIHLPYQFTNDLMLS